MMIPTLKPLRERFPAADITFLTSPSAAPVLEGNPFIDKIETVEPFWFYNRASKKEWWRFIRNHRSRYYDLIIEGRGDIRNILLLAALIRSRFKLSSGIGGGSVFLTHRVPCNERMHRVDYHLSMMRALGCRIHGVEWSLYPDRADREHVSGLLCKYGVTGPFIAIHPGSRLALKTWPADRFAELCRQLLKQYSLPIVLLGTGAEAPVVSMITSQVSGSVIGLIDAVNLKQLADLLSRAQVFICNDSAPMHIAAAMQVPTAAIFGPSKSDETGPYIKRCAVIENDYPCRFTCDENSCSFPSENECLKSIGVEQVLKAVSLVMRSAS